MGILCHLYYRWRFAAHLPYTAPFAVRALRRLAVFGQLRNAARAPLRDRAQRTRWFWRFRTAVAAGRMPAQNIRRAHAFDTAAAAVVVRVACCTFATAAGFTVAVYTTATPPGPFFTRLVTHRTLPAAPRVAPYGGWLRHILPHRCPPHYTATYTCAALLRAAPRLPRNAFCRAAIAARAHPPAAVAADMTPSPPPAFLHFTETRTAGRR